jgi:hypothetical protein
MPIGSRAALAAVLMICADSVQAGTEDEVKAQFSKFVATLNAHDLKAVSDTLLDSPQFLWITRGAPIWGREAALKRFEVQPGVAQVYVPITFRIAPAGQAAQPTRFLMNQILVKTPEGWKVSSVLPIPVPMQ